MDGLHRVELRDDPHAVWRMNCSRMEVDGSAVITFSPRRRSYDDVEADVVRASPFRLVPAGLLGRLKQPASVTSAPRTTPKRSATVAAADVRVPPGDFAVATPLRSPLRRLTELPPSAGRRPDHLSIIAGGRRKDADSTVRRATGDGRPTSLLEATDADRLRANNEYVDCPTSTGPSVPSLPVPLSSPTLRRLDSLPVGPPPSPRPLEKSALMDCPVDADCHGPVLCARCGRCRCRSCRGVDRRELPVVWCGPRCGQCTALRAVEYVSCVCCVEAAVYHCSADDVDADCKPGVDFDPEVPDDTGSPCSCAGGPSEPRCRRRWACLAALASIGCLPCLLIYWPLRWAVAGCRAVYDACGPRRRGCRCPSPSAGRREIILLPDTESSSA